MRDKVALIRLKPRGVASVQASKCRKPSTGIFSTLKAGEAIAGNFVRGAIKAKPLTWEGWRCAIDKATAPPKE